MRKYLSKSAFKLASSCPTKLYYYLNKYPSARDSNPFDLELQRNGEIIGKLAQLYYPEGIEVTRFPSLEDAVHKTTELLNEDKVTIFEAGFLSNQKIAFIDVLVKSGNLLELIEVKSKALDGDRLNNSGNPGSQLKDYIKDVAFQYHVVKELYPHFHLKAFLFCPDKSRAATIDSISQMFTVTDNREVLFSGDAAEVAGQDLLYKLDVTDACISLQAEIELQAETLLRSIYPVISKSAPVLNVSCRNCEFRTDDEMSGFAECWGELAHVAPHLFDLREGTTIDKGKLFNSLIHEKKVSLFDIPLESLRGKRAARQALQIKQTKLNQEFIDEKVEDEISSLKYPLYFVDFETASPVLPSFKGMKPFQLIAFQWSAHVVDRTDTGFTITHKEFLSEDGTFPNFRFAQSLREALKEPGTFIHWSNHEKTVMSSIAEHLDHSAYPDPTLSAWLKTPTGITFMDLEGFIKRYYFHPSMKGSTSLKYVLPAVWKDNLTIHSDRWFSDFATEQGATNPYDCLVPVVLKDKTICIRDGTAAITAYEEMCYRRDDINEKKALSDGLKAYCALDTLAMVMVWKKFVNRR